MATDVADPTLTAGDIPDEIQKTLQSNPAKVLAEIAASGGVTLDGVKLGDPMAPTASELMTRAQRQMGDEFVVEDKTAEKRGERPAHITLFKSQDGRPRRCTLRYKDGTGREHDFGAYYLSKRFLPKTHPTVPKEWHGMPVFLINPPGHPQSPLEKPLEQIAPFQSLPDAIPDDCPVCKKTFVDQANMEKHLKNKHPSAHAGFLRRIEEDDRQLMRTQTQSLIDVQTNMAELLTGLLGGSAETQDNAPPGTNGAELAVDEGAEDGDQHATLAGQWAYRAEAREFFGLTDAALDKRAKSKSIVKSKDPDGKNVYFVPDIDWEPASKSEA